MSFTRIGTPVSLDAVNFNAKDAYSITCEHCGKKAGRGHKRLAKFIGSEIIVVAPREFLCPKCKNISVVVKQ